MHFSIVTVAMNRTEHLLRSVSSVSQITGHDEHIVLDFGSSIPIYRDQLPADKRIKLHRVESPSGSWWLTHAYNLAFSLAAGDFILKLDADVLLSQEFVDELCKQQSKAVSDLMCNRLTLQDWSLPSGRFITNGLFFCRRSSLEDVGGFNPYIQGWGWDEVDLYSRFFLSGYSVSRIPSCGVDLLEHDDDLRANSVRNSKPSALSFLTPDPNKVDARNKICAHNAKNRQIALASIMRSLYWPSLMEYAHSYQQVGRMAGLPRVKLFEHNELQELVDSLCWHLLQPTRFQHQIWSVMAKLGFGPYTKKNIQSLFDACNVRLDLIS